MVASFLNYQRKFKTERDRERQRDRETERQRDRDTERKRDRETLIDRETERQRDYKFIQNHSRGLNRVPARTYIFACLNQLSYRSERQRDRETERQR